MNEIEEKIINLTEEQKLERLEEETNYAYIKALVMHLQKDENKLKMLHLLHENDVVELICSLQSDDLKLDYIRKLPQDTIRAVEVAKSIESDYKKSEALPIFQDEYARTEIIMTMQLDTNKINAMQEYIRKMYNRRKIITTFINIQNKIDGLNYIIDDDYERRKVIESISFENDKQLLQVIAVLKTDFEKILLINLMDSIENKEKAIEMLKFDGNKIPIIITLPEEKRLQYIPILEEYCKDGIINSLTEDVVKKQALSYVEKEEDITRILMRIEDDEFKLQYLQTKLKDETNQALVMATFQKDEQKLSLAKTMKEKANQVLIQMSLKDRETLKELFLKQDRKYQEIDLGPEMTIGIEIETEGPKGKSLCQLEKFLVRQDEFFQRKRFWNIEDDGSLSELRGAETISPILRDTSDNVEEIYMVCEMLEQMGQEATDNCGGHVHIGADYLTSKEAYINLFEIWGNTERIMYLMSNEPGNIPRSEIDENAGAFSSIVEEAIEKGSIRIDGEEDLEEFVSGIQSVQDGYKFFGMNLLNVNNGKNTIEFRVANGTINPDTWIENIRLFGRIEQVSQELAEIEKKEQITKEEKTELELKEKLKEDLPEKEKMELLLDLLFFEDEKEVYRTRYIENVKILENMREEDNPLREINFVGKLGLKKSHKLEEFVDVANQERYETVGNIEQETIRGINGIREQQEGIRG